MPARDGNQSGPVLKGTGGSGGRVTAPARVLAGAEDFVIHFRGRDSADLRSFVTDHLSTHSIVAATNTSLIFERTDGLRGV